MQLTGHFLMTMIAAMCGGPFLYGFNMAVVNTPSPMIRMFYTEVYAKRAGYAFPTPPVSNVSGRAFGNTSWTQNVVNGTQGTQNASEDQFVKADRDHLKLLQRQLGVDLLWTLTVSICLIGGMLGAFASGKLADKLGRKKALLLNQVFCIVGAVLFAIVKVTRLPELMFIARFLVGIASGVGLGLAPLYLSEVSTAPLRGPATSACHLAVTFGILVSQLLGLSALLGTDDGWPFLFAITAVPSLVTVALLPFCPETPRFMMTSRNAGYNEVLKTYTWLYGASLGEQEAQNLRKELIRRRMSSAVDKAPEEEPAVGDVSTNDKVAYTAGGDDKPESVAIAEKEPLSKTTSVVSKGRRESMSQKAITLGRLFCSEEFRLPIFLALWLHVTQQWSGINAVIAYSGKIFERILPANVVQYAVLSTGVASVVSTAVVLPFMSRWGRRTVVLVSCAVMTASHLLLTLCSALSPVVPELNFVSIAFIIIYICGYAGTGCTPAILVSEMFLQNARAVAMSLAIATRWGSAFILLLAFPYMDMALGVYVFLVFGFVCLLSLVLFCIWLHETRGKPPLQIHDQLAHGFEHVQFHLHIPHFHSHAEGEKCTEQCGPNGAA